VTTTADDGTPVMVELLQQLIRNRCVSSGFPSVGEESRNADTLASVLEGPGLDLEVVEPTENRAAVVARIDGSDPSAPSLCLLGHTDVVPVEEAGWSRDPFGGELIDGEVWGRGAVDMLNQTGSMALAVRRLADSGFRPRGDIVFVGAPDEECGGRQGVKLLLEQYPDLVRADYAVTEIGGAVRRSRNRTLLEAYVAEKGAGALRVHVRGNPSHSSVPYGSDNALVTAAEVVLRLATWRSEIRILDTWRGWVQAQGFDPDLEAVLVDAGRLRDELDSLPPRIAATAHACTHDTVAPTVLRSGKKVNVIPGAAILEVNVRVLPGRDPEEVVDELRALFADLGDKVEVEALMIDAGSESSTDSPLWAALERVARTHHPDAVLVPSMTPAATDARWMRPAGIPTYGFGVLSAKVTPSEYWSRFHGHDERIDVESLGILLSAWEQLATDFVG
jgi:acetylornithine deacetylase/succinyl-diaminopimelate desuccinylase-like protein